MQTALFLSPHLDDVAFSCGGLAAQLGDAGWRTVMATAFTRTIHPATGFALACQLDKGLGPEVDYMALRRAEDAAAAAMLGTEAVWLDLPEAPHRGYHSAPALFGPMLEADPIVPPLTAAFRDLRDRLAPALVLAPQGLGNHVDHRQVILAALAVFDPAQMAFYRDTPYVIREPGAPAWERVPLLPRSIVGIATGLGRKIAASAAYASQIGFQFKGAAALDDALRSFAVREGNGAPAEAFLAREGLLPA